MSLLRQPSTRTKFWVQLAIGISAHDVAGSGSYVQNDLQRRGPEVDFGEIASISSKPVSGQLPNSRPLAN